ncbi:MAG: ABC transporter permease [Acidobacteriaceae bacterium]|nr:ABC transporter permease [Acidobacteriaceae bacterium]
MLDFRQAIRSILKAPVFVVAAILTIAVGIGANTAVYAVVHAVLLDPLPFRQPEQIIQLWETHPELHNVQIAVPDYLDWKRSIQSVDLAAYTFQAMDKATLSGAGESVPVQGTNAGWQLFPLLGIQPLAGRLYNGQDEATKAPLALISEHLWRSKFSADVGLIGRPIRLDGSSFTVVGVIPQMNAFPVWADVWMPLSLADPALLSTRKYHPLEVVGRLRPGKSIRDAELDTEKVAAQLSLAYPATNGKIGGFVMPLMTAVTGEVRPALVAAWIAVALVLLIACANLGHLMMSRSLNRRRDIAVRLALGAGRLAAFRGFLVESLILSLAGGALGMLSGYITLPLVQRLAQGQMPRLDAVGLNVSVLLYGFAAVLMLGALFALPSYLQIFRSDLNETISSAGARASGRQSRWSAVLMSGEVALSLAVSMAAILLVRSFALAVATEPGFQADHTVVFNAQLADGDWNKSYSLFQNHIAPELASIPGVEQVAAVNSVPMNLGNTEHTRFVTRFGIVGRQFEPGRFPTAQSRWCTPSFFDVLGIPLLSGRSLRESDYNQPRYLINQTFARRFFPHTNPTEQKLLLDVVSPQPTVAEIVGVVGDVREFGLTSSPEPTIYAVAASPEMAIAAKTSSADAAIRTAIRSAMRRTNPQKAIGPFKLLSDYVAESLIRQRFLLSLIATFAGLAMCLCVVGIYGVFSYSVARRAREFGIRSAIGAAASNLFGQIARECLTVIVPGLIAGLAFSVAGARFMRILLYRVSPTDIPSSCVAVMLVLFFSFASVILPAWRAAKADPATVLREQ